MRNLLKLSEVKKYTALSRTTIYTRIQEGLLTPPIKLGDRASAWPEDEIEAINNARIAGFSDDEIRELVKSLESRRRLTKGEILNESL
jgi:prophage regulatory protein